MTPRTVNLREVCRHVVEEHELAHPEGAIHFDSHGSFWGQWDPDRIAQVISNLIGNALEHGSQGRPVNVSLSEAGPEAVQFAVHNEGPAIPAETLPLLFDPFRRGVQPESGRGSRGLGLGLYIAHQIVTAHGGKLEVQSTSEGGTTLAATLPRRSTSLPAGQ